MRVRVLLSLWHAASVSCDLLVNRSSQFTHGTVLPGALGKRRLLIATPGGSASTLVMDVVEASGIASNSKFNRDQLKHKNADAMRHLVRAEGPTTSPDKMDKFEINLVKASQGDDGAERPVIRRGLSAEVYDRILVLIGLNAAQIVSSTVQRFDLQHYLSALRYECGDCFRPPKIPKKITMKERNRIWTPKQWLNHKGADLVKVIYASATRYGRDRYGVQWFFDSWAAAQRAPGSWPPILVADVETLIDPTFLCPLVHFFGVANTTAAESLRELLDPSNLSTERFSHPKAHRLADRKHINPDSILNSDSRRLYDNISASIADVVDQNRRFYEAAYRDECAPR